MKAQKVEANKGLGLNDEVSKTDKGVTKHARNLEQLAVRVDEIVKALHRFERLSVIATGRNRNVVISSILDPKLRGQTKRKQAATYHVRNLMRLADITAHATLKRVLRLGQWKNSASVEGTETRPLLVEFANPKYRDRIFAAAGTIKEQTSGGVCIAPDDCALGRSLRNKMRLGFNTAKLNSITPKVNLCVEVTRLRDNELESTGVNRIGGGSAISQNRPKPVLCSVDNEIAAVTTVDSVSASLPRAVAVL